MIKNGIFKERKELTVKLLKKLFKLASTTITSALMPLIVPVKCEYNLSTSEDSCNSSNSPTMVETSSPLNRNRGESVSPNPSLSPQSPHYLNSTMLLNSQNYSYFGQRLSNLHSDLHRNLEHNSENTNQLLQQHKQLNSTPTSLFTIDSILASKPSSRQSESPPSSPILDSPKNSVISTNCNNSNGGSNNSLNSPIRPTRVPTMLHHPGLHLSHLAAAAASGFGTPSDFLGE